MNTSSAQPRLPLARVACSALLAFAIPATASAASISLVYSSLYLNWEDPINWNPARLPTINDDVFIGFDSAKQSGVSVSAPPSKQYAAYARSVSLSANGSMSLHYATLDIQGQLSQAGNLQVLYGSQLTALEGAVLRSGGRTQLTSGDAPVIWPRKPSTQNAGATLSTGQSTLSIESGHTLYGSGVVQSANIVNRGEILSEGWLMIGRTDNTGGLVGTSPGRGGATLLTNGVVHGGTVQGNVNGTFSGVNIISASGRFNLVGDITNNGQMIISHAKGMNGPWDPGALIGQPGVFIRGQGSIRAEETHTAPALIQDIGFGSGQVFTGGATVRGQLINQGLMQVTGHDLAADPAATGTWINQGRIEVSSAITGATIDNAQGTIYLNGQGRLNNSHVKGGMLQNTISGQLGNVKLEDLSLNGEFLVGAATEILGSVRNLGNLIVQSWGQLLVKTGALNNDKLIRLRSDGLLSGTQVLNSAMGRIDADSDARLHGVVIRGGTIGAAYTYSGARFHTSGDVHLSDVQVADPLSFVIKDSITLSGQVGVANQLWLTGNTDDGRPAMVNIQGQTVLSGKGRSTLAGSTVLHAAGPLDSLTIASDHALTALGDIQSTIINHGTLTLGEGRSQLIRDALTNSGRVLITSQTTVQAMGGINNQNGFIEIGQNAKLQAMATGLSGGTVHGAQTGSRLWASELRDVRITGDVTLGGTETASTGGTTIKNQLTVDGRLQVADQSASLRVSGDVVLQGSGATLMQSNQAAISASPDHQGTGGPTLTIAAEHTLFASGNITNVQLINKGQVFVQQTDLHLADPRTLNNQGTLIVRSGQLIVGGSLIQDSETARMVLDRGHVLAADTRIEQGQMMLREATIEGNLTLGNDADVWLDLSAQASAQSPFARIHGSLTLAGTLTLSFLDAAEAAPSYFLFESTTESVNGGFSRVLVLGSEQAYQLNIEAGRVYAVRTAAVPEPGTWLLMLVGLSALGWSQRLRRR
jgi:filamentous hemagglutinin